MDVAKQYGLVGPAYIYPSLHGYGCMLEVGILFLPHDMAMDLWVLFPSVDVWICGSCLQLSEFSYGLVGPVSPSVGVYRFLGLVFNSVDVWTEGVLTMNLWVLFLS